MDILNIIKGEIKLPYCRRCGKEFEGSTWLCPVCEDLNRQFPSQSQPTMVQQSTNNYDELFGVLFQIIIFIAIIIAAIYFVTSVQLFDCPSCDNNVWVRWACTYCGQDGKVALLDLIKYSIR